MSLSIKQDVAQQIVEAIKDVCSHDINFINSRGIIFASTNKSRIGDFHEIGLQAIKTGETIEVTTDTNFMGTQKGVNIPLRERSKNIKDIFFYKYVPERNCRN